MREQSTGAGSASRSGLARCTPSREAARGLASEFALIPVYREVLADMLTPVRAYTLLCPPGEPGAWRRWSAVGAERHQGPVPRHGGRRARIHHERRRVSDRHFTALPEAARSDSI